jgi:hypothetical protein
MNDVEEKIGKLVEALSRQGNDRHVKALNLTGKTKQCGASNKYYISKLDKNTTIISSTIVLNYNKIR